MSPPSRQQLDMDVSSFPGGIGHQAWDSEKMPNASGALRKKCIVRASSGGRGGSGFVMFLGE